MKILIPLAIVVTVLLVYAVWGRDWLKSKPWAAGFFAWVEPVEIVLFKKSETILFARLKMVTGLLLTILAQLGTLDLSPIIPFVPEKYQGIVNVIVNSAPALLTIVGWLDEKLRNGTTKPLELVAIPDKVVADNPIVAQTMAKADELKVEAVAVAEVATAEAKVV